MRPAVVELVAKRQVKQMGVNYNVVTAVVLSKKKRCETDTHAYW
jgi:hypothetical protein